MVDLFSCNRMGHLQNKMSRRKLFDGTKPVLPRQSPGVYAPVLTPVCVFTAPGQPYLFTFSCQNDFDSWLMLFYSLVWFCFMFRLQPLKSTVC
jgi:hypothetical protein